jgi:hypothetical protein
MILAKGHLAVNNIFQFGLGMAFGTDPDLGG